ncbi:MAG: SiaB family protein kinase, partial [Flavobacteriales bacterium]
SGNKLLYEFESLGNGFHNFHQQVYFSKDDSILENQIAKTKKLYKGLENGHLLLTYKGDFSQKSILPLLNIVESNIGKTKEEISMAKKVGHVLIEMLQNISRHAVEIDGSREGVFLIGKQENHFFVQTGNLISEKDKENLTARLGSILSMNDNELIDLHRQRIRDSINLVDKSKSGLGLIQIAKASYSPISYNFQPYNEKTFFTLKVVV